MNIFPTTVKGRLLLLLAMGASLPVLVWGCDVWVKATAAPFCEADLSKIAPMDVALVLGCSPKIGSQMNLFYKYRMDAAAALYRKGKVKAFIVSGDNSSHAYDEPTAMKDSLMVAGVPAEAIYCDYAGFRTLDSVVRAQAVFGQKSFLIVSQRFHNERAVFIARQHGLDAVGYNAKDVPTSLGMRTLLREYLARVNAALDVTLLQTSPKFYGPRIEIAL